MKREWSAAVLGLVLVAAIVIGPRLLPEPGLADADRDGSPEWEAEIRTLSLCDAMGNARVPRFVASTLDRAACDSDPTVELSLCDSIYRVDGTLREIGAGPTDAVIVTACGLPPT